MSIVPGDTPTNEVNKMHPIPATNGSSRRGCLDSFISFMMGCFILLIILSVRNKYTGIYSLEMASYEIAGLGIFLVIFAVAVAFGGDLWFMPFMPAIFIVGFLGIPEYYNEYRFQGMNSESSNLWSLVASFMRAISIGLLFLATKVFWLKISRFRTLKTKTTP